MCNKENYPYLISVGGIAYSASGAVIDLLREYEYLQVETTEFRPFIAGLDTLLPKIHKGMDVTNKEISHVYKKTRMLGCKRSFVEDLIHKGTMAVANNLTSLIPCYLNRKKFDYNSLYPEYSNATLELFENLKLLNENNCEDGLSKIIKNYLEKIFGDKGEKTVVLNQFLRPCSFTGSFVMKIKNTDIIKTIAELIPSIRIIVVIRDPRDLYCDIMQIPYRKNKLLYGKSIDYFVETYREIFSHTDSIIRESPENVIKIQFEDLIFNYAKSTETIENFLGLQEKAKSPLKYFDPKESISNTQMYTEYPNKHEIEKIEDELSKWLYDFY